MSEKMIELNNLKKSYISKDKTVEALKDVSIEVNQGDIYGVIGYSGAGKSTLIRCINLLERPDSGKVIIQGENILEYSNSKLREFRKKTGMIFQHFNLMNRRTVEDNIALALKGSKLSKQEIKTKVHHLLELVELLDKSKSYPSELSGGQKQRVAIARALANNPTILLCDEATSALDPKTTQSILKLLKRLKEELKLTVVIITHEMEVVKQICNKVAVMENGLIVEQGDIRDIFINPTSNVTKEFINTSNHMDEIYELINENHELVNLEHDESIYRFEYVGTSAKDAIISKLSTDYHLKINIIFGNIEVINSQPIGNLVVKIQGTNQDVNKALDYVRDQEIKVEGL